MYKILANPAFAANKVHYLPSCHSTNGVARQLLQDARKRGLPPPLYDGWVVITDHQTAGRGQAGAVWESAPGQNLTFSLLLQPAFLEPHRQFLITVAVSLGLREALHKLGVKVQIKWPNDIWSHDGKLAGMLIENILRGRDFEASVVGIGLNVNQTTFSAGLPAVSLRQLTGQEWPLPKVLEEVVAAIGHYYARLRQGEGSLLQKIYDRHLLGYGRELSFTANGEFDGIIRGTDEIGRLLVEREGRLLRFQHKEISLAGR